MFAFLNSLVPDSVRGAQVLKALRWLSVVVGTAVTTFCISHGFNATDAASIGTAVGGVVIAAGSGLYSLWDAKNVGVKSDALVVSTAQKTVQAIEAGDGTATQAIKVAAASGSPDAAKQVLAVLAAGKE